MDVKKCPGCSKKISDKAKSCSHCNINLSGTDSEKIATLHRVNLINKSQRLMNYSFIAMLLFCGGFLFMFWDNVEQGTWQHTMAMISAVIGFVIYIIIRAMLLLTKRKIN
jgi:hypothetical protein